MAEDYVPVNLEYVAYTPAEDLNSELSPVIFVHGSLQAKEYWCDIPQKIADETKRLVYSYDARNHGDSEWTDNFNFDILSDDLMHFMDTHDVDKAILIGHSMGGVTIIKAALRWPDRVEMIIVEDMYAKKIAQPIIDNAVAYITLFKEIMAGASPDFEYEEAVKYAVDASYSQTPDAEDCDRTAIYNCGLPIKKDENGRWVAKSNLDVIHDAMEDYDTLMSDPEGSYDGPAIFVSGQLSVFHVQDEQEHIQQFFPAAEFHDVENATHSIHNEKPEEFTDIVLNSIANLNTA